MNTLNDVFIEKLVKRKSTTQIIVLKALIVVAALILCISVFFTPLINVAGPVPFFVVGWVAWIFIRRLNIEFEYSLTNGELDVDIIIGLKKRKHMLSLRFSDIDFMAPVSEQYSDKFSDKNVETIFDAASAKDSPDRWFVIFRKDGHRCKLIFEPNERMVEGMHRYNPQNVKMLLKAVVEE